MKFRVERAVESADGTQTFEVEADTEAEALVKFRDDQGEIVEWDVEVTSLSPASAVSIHEIYES